jgi:hypothetical protein
MGYPPRGAAHGDEGVILRGSGALDEFSDSRHTSDTQLLPPAYPVQPVGPALLVHGTTRSSMVSFSHKPDLLRDKAKQHTQVNAQIRSAPK